MQQFGLVARSGLHHVHFSLPNRHELDCSVLSCAAQILAQPAVRALTQIRPSSRAKAAHIHTSDPSQRRLIMDCRQQYIICPLSCEVHHLLPLYSCSLWLTAFTRAVRWCRFTSGSHNRHICRAAATAVI